MSIFWRKQINYEYYQKNFISQKNKYGKAYFVWICVDYPCRSIAFNVADSSKERVVTPFLSALFTTTSATCVTGLTLINVGAYFSLFGQAVILFLIQLGGLGFMTILCIVFIVSNRQIGLRNRMLIAQTMGTESLEGIVKLAKHVLHITGIIELLGAIVLSIRFVPKYGFFKGMWFSIFHSVSAFCNAGFDIIGDGKSMLSYRHDPLVLCTLAILVAIGGLGFIVWEDIIAKKSWKKLNVYSKVIILAQIFFIVVGTFVYFILEYGNINTIGAESVGQKILASFFQSVTTRTAGFDALIQNNLTDLSKAWGTVLMMIGGCFRLDCQGGVKLGTAVLVIMTLISVLRGKSDVVIHGRRVAHTTILQAMALLVLWLVLVVGGSVLISYIDNQDLINSIYEVASAYSTVGLSVGVSGSASTFTKILLIVYMFFGRVGIMTISVVFMTRIRKTNDIRYPECNFIVG